MISNSGPIFVHSDIGKGLIAAKRYGARIDVRSIQSSLIAFLASHASEGEDSLVFPAFNYDYGKTRAFDIENDPVQVGALPEWIRLSRDFYRTEVPFFSFLTKNDLGLPKCETINPFDSTSGFHRLVQEDAVFLMFGAGFGNLTFIHYIEEMSGKPLYRYEKRFSGKIIISGQTRPCDFTMHVRPMGIYMDYDWVRLEKELISNGKLKISEKSIDIKWIKAKTILEFWGNKISDDPFYLLDDESRLYFNNVTNGGKHRVKMADYEVA